MAKTKTVGGRPKTRSSLPPALARKMIRQHRDLYFAIAIFGPYACAEELIRRYKLTCGEKGRKYNRQSAIEEAANLVRMDSRTLTNWLARSKAVRDRYY
jgi:hypothetical protein